MAQHIDCTSCGGSGLDSAITESGELRPYTGLSGFADQCGTCLGMKVIPAPAYQSEASDTTELLSSFESDLRAARLGRPTPTPVEHVMCRSTIEPDNDDTPAIDPEFPTSVRAFLAACEAGTIGTYDVGDVSNADFTEFQGSITVEIGGDEWAVMTDSDADSEYQEQTWGLVWAFHTKFLASHVPDGCEEAVLALQEKSEDGNAGIQALIEAGSGKEHFLMDAKQADGRGQNLSSYDGEEHEIAWNGEAAAFYAYRTN